LATPEDAGAGCEPFDTGGAVAVGAGGGAGCAHDSDTPNTGNFTGKEIDDNGVPGGTSTVNDNVRPPTRVTVTVQGSADADGRPVRPAPTATAAAAVNATSLVKLTVTTLFQLVISYPWVGASANAGPGRDRT
jgi:hypothetical protein